MIRTRRRRRTPKAIGVQARTLEIYEQIGLADKLIDLGWKAAKARLIVGGEVRGEVDFSDIGKGMSDYPYVLIVEQGNHESLIYDFIKSNGKDVRWKTELESFSQDDSGVTAKIKNSDGETETVEAKFLVGCDGSKSPVRHALGLTFEGMHVRTNVLCRRCRDRLGVQERRADGLSDEAQPARILSDGRENRWRIVGTFPEEFAKDEGEVLYEEIEEQIKRDAELELDITNVNWFSTYKVHTRHVNKFSEGRCFLAGDSAHIHTPAGAQGMNTGIQDGYNLAWKTRDGFRRQGGREDARQL